MLIAISGSQGSGKSTLLDVLQKKGLPVVERKTSRSIQKDWGYTLEEINAEKGLTVKFQWEILQRKLQDESTWASGVHGLCGTERTYADLFTYALIVLGKEPSCNNFLNDYFDECKRAQSSYHKVFYLTAGHFVAESDPHRASMNQHYQRLVDVAMLDFTKQLTDPSKLVIIDTPDLKERTKIILENI